MKDSSQYIGIDLGAFESRVVSADGQRYSAPSAVAWPSDVFWDDVADGICQFGDHLLEINPELDVIRPMQNGLFRFLDPSEATWEPDRIRQADHSLSLLVKHVVEGVASLSGTPICGVIGCPVRASRKNQKTILDLVRPLLAGVMIVPDPVLTAFACDRTSDALIIDIGAGTTDISVIRDGQFHSQFSISLPMGGDWVEDALAHEILSRHDGLRIPKNTLREIKEVFGTLYEDSTPATLTVIDDDSQTDLNVRESLTGACRQLGPSIANAVLEVLSNFESSDAQILTGNAILTGGTSAMPGIEESITQVLSGFGPAELVRVSEPRFACAIGACKIAQRVQQKDWEQLASLNLPRDFVRAA